MNDSNLSPDFRFRDFERVWAECDDERDAEEIQEFWLERSEWLKENLDDEK